MRPFVRGWMSERVRPSVTLCLVGMIQTTDFTQSLSNFNMHVVDDEKRNPSDFESQG